MVCQLVNYKRATSKEEYPTDQSAKDRDVIRQKDDELKASHGVIEQTASEVTQVLSIPHFAHVCAS